MIKIERIGDMIVVSGDGHTYSRPADLPAQNEFGFSTGETLGEAFEAGRLFAFDDPTSMMYGSLIAKDPPFTED